MLFIRKCLRGVGVALLALLIFFEEWGWKPLSRLMGVIARLPPLAWLEAQIRRAPRQVALVLFVVPAIVLLPFKLGALWLIAHGQKTLGIVVIVLAKLIGTALLGRLFVLTEQQLMSYAWFAKAIFWWSTTRQRIVSRIKASSAWQTAAAFMHNAREKIRTLFT
jgi:hypothetical protein